MRPLLTVLTTPIRNTRARAYAGLRRTLRTIVKPNAPALLPSQYPGHHSLVRSVVEGLRAIGADFNFNPVSVKELGRVVYAPANEALRQAIGFKQQAMIDALVAGPTNALLPHESDGIILSPEIDALVVASDWVRALHASEAPEIAGKLRVCPAGVDADEWAPRSGARARRALVYWKDAPEALCEQVEARLDARGIGHARIRYGSYDAATFKTLLSESMVAVFLSTFETQGLALAEAWAMDVPTLVWDPQGPTQWQGSRTFTAGSSAPYLTLAAGRTWKTIDELDRALNEVLASPERFTPRDWVLNNMTDAQCAGRLYEIVNAAALQ